MHKQAGQSQKETQRCIILFTRWTAPVDVRHVMFALHNTKRERERWRNLIFFLFSRTRGRGSNLMSSWLFWLHWSLGSSVLHESTFWCFVCIFLLTSAAAAEGLDWLSRSGTRGDVMKRFSYLLMTQCRIVLKCSVFHDYANCMLCVNWNCHKDSGQWMLDCCCCCCCLHGRVHWTRRLTAPLEAKQQ